MSSFRMTPTQFKREAAKTFRKMNVESVEVEADLLEYDNGNVVRHEPTGLMFVTIRGSYRVAPRRPELTAPAPRKRRTTRVRRRPA
jgi:hypothetical protein